MPSLERQFRVLGAVFSLGFVAVALALLYWQVGAASELTARADNPRRWEEEARTVRGRILDRQGRDLALSQVMPGQNPQRRYPYPALAHVVGLLNPRLGTAGIEKSLDDELAGRSLGGGAASHLAALLHRPRVGNDVGLTIDLDVQRAADEAMKDAPGAAVALDARTGAILALASRPLYDPNGLAVHTAASLSAEGQRTQALWDRLVADPARPLLNRAAQGLYSPGSTFKTVTLVSALERGAAKPADLFQFTYKPADANHPFPWHNNQYVSCHNHPQVGRFDLAGAYGWSCNVVFADLALAVGPQAYQESMRRFGLGEAPPLEIPTVASLPFTTPNFFGGDERFYALAATGMGQGELLITPLQMALVVAGVVNEGRVPRPHLVREVRYADGRSESRAREGTWKVATDPATARLARQMMVASVQGGWARPAAIPGLEVGGKTGTAEHGGDEPHGWFIGYAAAGDRLVAVAVVKESAGSGTLQAIPVARAMLQAAMK